jgi:hypothetical protein
MEDEQKSDLQISLGDFVSFPYSGRGSKASTESTNVFFNLRRLAGKPTYVRAGCLVRRMREDGD